MPRCTLQATGTSPEALDADAKRLQWQTEQLDELPRVFGPYLAFDSFRMTPGELST